MGHRKTRTLLLFPLLACGLATFSAADVWAKLTPKQARTALTRMAGMELNNATVRVRTISETNTAEAQVSAEIRTVLKLAQEGPGRWRVAEIRTGPDRWEQVDLVVKALGAQQGTEGCTAPDPPAKGSTAIDPSLKRVRCLLGALLGVEVPSDAIRIQAVTPMAVPLASQASATVVAWIRLDARLRNDRKGWRVTEVRTGNRDWVQLEPLSLAVDEEKQRIARAELDLIASALEKFRKDRGFYVVSDSQAIAIDHLSPRYLLQVIRIDPWNQPYLYLGEPDRFTLRSAGPDRKPDTPDDIQRVSPSR